MVRQWQELFENKRYSGTPLTGPDFQKLAEAYGWKGMRVDATSEVEGAIETAYATDGPVLIDFRVEREVNVFPMVPAGGSLSEMIMGDVPRADLGGDGTEDEHGVAAAAAAAAAAARARVPA
jgi:acetolactate synthase-1/2/3 large subunit